jgi:hypothetical protein
MAEPTVQTHLLNAGDDFVATFQIEDTSVRGRVARLGDGVLDPILKRHDYPRWAAYLLGEAVTLAVLVSASLKFDGKVMVQAQGEGPVSLLVAEARSDGGVRGYLRLNKEKWDFVERVNKGQRPHIPQALGRGTMALLLQPNDPIRRRGRASFPSRARRWPTAPRCGSRSPNRCPRACVSPWRRFPSPAARSAGARAAR